jgi:hypothetical protein
MLAQQWIAYKEMMCGALPRVMVLMQGSIYKLCMACMAACVVLRFWLPSADCNCCC